MSLLFERNDQQTVHTVATEFIKFYYDNLNSKNYQEINTLIKPYTLISFEKVRYEGKDMATLFQRYNDMNMQFIAKDYDTLHSGARRINIVITGAIRYIEAGQQMERQFTEYIHLATSKGNNFWIQMAIFKLI